ncbi:NUC189-domain-containing protein [Xylariaceae sp. FL0594]|nr:NUC189-domain-containing protein [Xylariaceae sp. FL0594]
MSTRRKTPAKIAQPVVRQSARRATRAQINESDAVVSVPEIRKPDSADRTEDIIEISSDPNSSDYELSEQEQDQVNGAKTQKASSGSNVQKPVASVNQQKRNDDPSGDVPMTEANAQNETESDQEAAQPTLGELARAHGTIDVASAIAQPSNAVVAQGRTVAPPSHSSLGTVLSQALRTDDSALLESCLQVHDNNTINNTIQRLDSTLAGTLLHKLASRMHRRPGRAGSLMTWVQATLVCHGGALAAQPGVIKKLRELQRVLDERAKGLNSLLALKGKLDLMNAQLQLRREQWGSEDVQEEEGIVYVEGEDSDVDMANGLMDLDDDELPVTNGIMDDESEDDDLPSDGSDGEEELDAEEELDEDEVDHDDIESDDEDSETEAVPQPPAKKSKPSRGR